MNPRRRHHHRRQRRALLDRLLTASILLLAFAIGVTAARFVPLPAPRSTTTPIALPRAFPQSPSWLRVPKRGYEI